MENNTIGTINIDFDILSNSPKELLIYDLSDWVYSENLPSYVSIVLPGSSKAKTFSFTKNRINAFNSHNLGISCLKGDCTEEVYVDLPDGIYTICVKSSYEGIEATKFYLKTDRFEIEKAKVAIKFGFEYSRNNREFIEAMLDIEWLLVVAKSHAKLGDFVKAQQFFIEASNILRKYADCKDCL